MPEVLGNPPSPRAVLFWNGTAWQWALVDAAGHIQIDVVTSGLPVGAATAAAQALALAQLQLIEDMRDALQSVGTDRLIVRGEDQLFSFHDVLSFRTTDTISGANGWAASAGVPAGEIWIVTTVWAVDLTSPVTRIQVANRHDGANAFFHEEIKAFAAGDPTHWSGMVTMEFEDTIRAYFPGGLAGDSCAIDLNGYIMTLEA